jgi:hypothetical protein
MRILVRSTTAIFMGLCLATGAAAAAAPKLKVGVALPRAQLGQGNGEAADVAEPVRQALLAYLKGPALEVVPLEARIPLQINAEAKEKGCDFVLFTDVTQTKKSSGFGMLKKLAPLAAAVPMMGAGMGSMGGQMAASVAAQTMMTASMQSAQEDAMANAMAAIGGAQKANIKAGDTLTFEYKLVKPGEETPAKADKVVGKAKENGQDVLSPLIESVAVAVVGTVAAK